MHAKIMVGLGGACLAALISGAIVHAASLPDETQFLSENTVAMNRMMAGMMVAPSGDVDADFTATMIPHHQGAIAMALAELRYGRNEQLRRIAQEIIVDQQQEIVAMRLALGQTLPPSAPAPTQVSAEISSKPAASSSVHDHSAVSHDAMSMSPAMQMQMK